MPEQDLNHLDRVFQSLTADGLAAELLRLAVREDLASAGDVTSRVVCGEEACGQALIRARQPGVLAGLAAFELLNDAFGAELTLTVEIQDGMALEAGASPARLSGRLREILTVERTLLNLLGRLSGIATLTRRYVDAIEGTAARICDTRKTTPGLRSLEKYAVRCGGGMNHRLGLFDAVLIKDNHLAGLTPKEVADTLREVMKKCAAEPSVRFVQVEVDTLDQLDAIFALGKAGPSMVLLDNMTPEMLREAVARREAMQPDLVLEASGGITLESVRQVAETGVDRISIGALTHSAVQLDLGLDIEG
jgi:nicotinate-nucleotide pyrophosphorylase (carboxylating)